MLSLFATLNAAFFPGGDVLLLFVFVGGFLVLVRHWTDISILILSIILLLQPVEWFHFIMSLTTNDYSLPNLGIGPLYGEVIGVAKTGEWLSFLKANLWTGQKASLFWAIGSGRFLQTAGLFLLGLYIGRKEFLFLLRKISIFGSKPSLLLRLFLLPYICLKCSGMTNLPPQS